MASILEKLKIKPVAETYKEVEIQLPDEAKVEIKNKIIDRRKSGYDRAAFKRKMQRRHLTTTVVEIEKPRIEIKEPSKVEPSATLQENIEIQQPSESKMEPTKVEEQTKVETGTIKIKKPKKLKRKLKISKRIQKGTITGISEPTKQKRLVIKRRVKLPQVPEEQMIFNLEEIGERLPEKQPGVKIRANAYYLNNRQFLPILLILCFLNTEMIF